MTRTRRLIVLPVLGTASLAVGILSCDRATDALDVSGTVEATEAALGFQLPGRIDSIAVSEGDHVQAGVPLAWLDRRELEARVRSAQSQADAARARLRELESGFRSQEIAQGEAAARAARRRAEEANVEFARAERLFEGGAISARQRDQASTAREVAKADLERAVEQLDLLRRGARDEQVTAQRALVTQAAATVDQLQATLEYAVVRAPFAGTVAIRHREPGEAVGAGAPIITVRNMADRWVRVFVPEARVGLVALGTQAEISADPFPDRTFAGEVSFLSDEAEFTPRTVQTAEERVKLVFRVKVRITGDSLGDLKPGLPVDVRLILPEP